MPQLLDMIEGHACAVLGEGSVQRIDATTPSSERYAAVQAFKADGCPVSLFLMAARSCGLGTDLPRVDTVLLFDSDWHPLLDIQVRGWCWQQGGWCLLQGWRTMWFLVLVKGWEVGLGVCLCTGLTCGDGYPGEHRAAVYSAQAGDDAQHPQGLETGE